MKIYKRDEWTLPAIIEDKANTWGDRIFLYYGNDQVTYNQLNVNANRVANALIDLGIKKSENVALMIPNCIEFFSSGSVLRRRGG